MGKGGDYVLFICLKVPKRLILWGAMGEKRAEMRPQCGRLGEAVVDYGPPCYFRVLKEATISEGTKMGCRCGEIFGIPGPISRRDGSGGVLHT